MSSGSLIEQIKGRLSVLPNRQLTAGLRSYTPEELDEVKNWLHEQGIKFKHKTHHSNGVKLPYNGVLYINPSKV